MMGIYSEEDQFLLTTRPWESFAMFGGRDVALLEGLKSLPERSHSLALASGKRSSVAKMFGHCERVTGRARFSEFVQNFIEIVLTWRRFLCAQ